MILWLNQLEPQSPFNQHHLTPWLQLCNPFYKCECYHVPKPSVTSKSKTFGHTNASTFTFLKSHGNCFVFHLSPDVWLLLCQFSFLLQGINSCMIMSFVVMPKDWSGSYPPLFFVLNAIGTAMLILRNWVMMLWYGKMLSGE